MSADLAPTPAGVWPDCPHHPGASHLQAHPKGWGWVCPVRRAEGLWTQQPVDAAWQPIEPVGRVRSSAFDLPGPTSLPPAPGEQPAQPETAPPPATTATIPLTILATGGRRWAHFERLCEALDQAAGEARGPVRLIVGDCPTGADQQARIWAKRRGVPVEVHRARWDEMAAEGKPRKAAGTLRNLAMLDALDQAGGDRKVLAFHDDLARSRGTRHCVHQARQRGYTVALVARQRVEILGREGRAEPGALRAAALEYARRGIPVVPLHYPVERQHKDQPPTVGCSCRAPDCQRIGKHPIGALTPHGVKDATTDSAVIAYWWQRYPQANIGLATGARFDVLDVDGRRGAAWLRRYAAEHGIRLAGPLAQSGSGGWHYYFAATGRACPPLRDPASGEAIAQVDWRGNGGVIVAPPGPSTSSTSKRTPAASPMFACG